MRELWVSGLLCALMIAGCSRERPLASREHQLPTLNLSDQIIEAVSPTFNDWENGRCGAHGDSLLIPDTARIRYGRSADLNFGVIVPNMCTASRVTILNRRTNEWMLLESHPGGGGCIPEGEQMRVLLSQFDPDPVKSFIGPMGEIRQKGGGCANVFFVKTREGVRNIPMGYKARVLAMTHDGERLWIVLLRGGQDSLEVFPKDGARDGVTVQTIPGVQGLAAAGNTIWIVYGKSPTKIGVVARDGTVTPAFDLADTLDGSTNGVAWADGLLWVRHRTTPGPDRIIDSLLAIDTERSILTGHAVVVRRIQDFRQGRFRWSLGWDGQNFLLPAYDTLLRFTPNGETVSPLPLPIILTQMAFDGEALWVTHRGTWETSASDEFLSRFYMR